MKAVRSILIVGGGSSGWMAAAYLSKILFDVEVTLIESESKPIIGVGEATFPFIRTFMRRIGLTDESDWMNKCDATYKAGILFRNWFCHGHCYWHPLFEDLDYVTGRVHSGHCWLSQHKNGNAFREPNGFAEDFFTSYWINGINKRIPDSSDYAYHFDVHLFKRLLAASAGRVRHLIDDVCQVQVDENGDIVGIATANSGTLHADLYIDCTGFGRHLMKRAAPEMKYVSYERSLLCDAAIVFHMPYADETEKVVSMDPFVTSSAASSGWIWKIPLYSQISSGYVYSSSFISESEAEAELRRHWGEDRTRDLTSTKIRFATGKLERLWVGNCVAIGLSGGFIEPLESSGLAVIQLGVEMLASMLDGRFYDRCMIDRYNGHLEKFYTDIMHFIVSHYIFSRRDDSSFWKSVRRDTLVPSELTARLEVFRKYLPSFSTKGTSEVWMFRDLSWFSVLIGMNFDFSEQQVEAEVLEAIDRIRVRKQQHVSQRLQEIPNHYQHLRDVIYSSNVMGRRVLV